MSRAPIVLAAAALLFPATAAADPTTTTVTPSVAQTFFGDRALTFTAQVTGAAGVPTGTVTFFVNDRQDGMPRPLDAQGRAFYDSTDWINVGDRVTATYSGAGTDDPSTGQATFTVLPARTRVTITSTPNPSPLAQDVSLVVAVANENTEVPPYGSVDVFVDGQTRGTFDLDADGTVALRGGAELAAGVHTVEARYTDTTGSPANFEPSTGTLTHTVQGPPPPPPPVVNPQPRVTPPEPFTVTRVSGARNGTITVVAELPAAGSVTATASAPRVTSYGRATKARTAPGRLTLTLRPSARAKRALAKGKSVKVKVRVRFTPAAGGAATTVSRTVTIKPRRAKGSRAPSPGSWRLASRSAGPR